MKNTLLSIVFIVFVSVNISAQNLSLSWLGGPIANGATLTMVGDTGETLSFPIACKNEGTVPIAVQVRKKEISVVPGSQNYFCWTSCFLPGTFVSPDSLVIEPDSTSNNFTGDYKSRGHIGASTIMYTFFDYFNLNDSISVQITYDCSLSSKENIIAPKVVFSNAFPNPAHEKTSFTYLLSESALNNTKLIIRDMLGNVVEEIPITESKGTLVVFTDKMGNGVHFYSLIVNGKTQFTKKLIIRH